MTSVIERKRRGQVRFLRLPEVLARTGLSRSTIYVRLDQGRFPQPGLAGMLVLLVGSRPRWTNGCASGSQRVAMTGSDALVGMEIPESLHSHASADGFRSGEKACIADPKVRSAGSTPSDLVRRLVVGVRTLGRDVHRFG